MTIAKRLILLLALPLLAMLGVGVFSRSQLADIEQRSRFVTETQIPSVAVLGSLSRSFAELRVNVRSCILATNTVEMSKAQSAFDANEAEVRRLLDRYADQLISDEKDRRLLDEYRTSSRDWIGGARRVMALAAAGHREEATASLGGAMGATSERLGKASQDWIQHNEHLATLAGSKAFAAIRGSRWKTLVANVTAILLTGGLGWITFRRIVRPIQALETCVKAIAAGDYTQQVPFIEATDETGSLARSVDVLKQGAATMEQQRWIKANASKVLGGLPGAASLPEFGERLLSGLVPLVGGGVAAFYELEENSKQLRRLTSYGLAEVGSSEDVFQMGEGLVGQCARERKVITLTDLPPNYLRVTSGLGTAPPVRVVALPLVSQGALLGVLELASLRECNSSQRALLDDLLPAAAMSFEVLQRNVRTQELLAQTQEQARLLEEKTQELTQSQVELLAQQRELTAQREQLKVSEERSRLILESSAEGIFGTDLEGRVTFINPAACRMLGFTAEELIGQPSHAAFHQRRADGSDYPREECPMFAAYRHGRASRIDDEFLWRKDGTGLPVEYGATPMLKDGSVVGAVVSFTDVTQRKRAEAELQNRSEELKRTNFLADSALDLTKAGYWHVPLDGSGWYNSSERATRIFGDHPTPDHRQRLDDWALHVQEGDEIAARATMDNFAAAMAGTIPVYDSVYAYKRPVDGRVVWIHALGHVVKDAGGKPTDMFGVTQDITEFKQLERELLGAKEKAEEATQMKSMFLANMSHEIRTPMNAIIGLSHLALKTQLSAKQRDYVSKVHNAGTSLLAVINDILDFSKIEAGKLEIETTDFKLDEVISSVTTLTAQKAHEKGLEFLAHVAPGIPEGLLGDPLRLGQILTNFVNNAVKFTERGEIRLDIQSVERTGEKVQLKFSVRDTGIGMTKEQAARLFQPFTQADMSTTRKHGGTGLGLTICLRLVELMGGRIWLESEPGVGTTFFFTVWLGVSDAKSSGKLVPEQLGKLRVLVVDDNSAAREILQEPLSTLANRVDVVGSGKEAIAAIQQHDAADPYDVIFMDWRMPGMDGLQASRHIKSDETLTHQPAIVLVTAFGREEVREEAERLQLDGFLVKPVTKSMIVDTLVNVFAQGTGEAAGVREAEPEMCLRGARILLAEDNEINQQIAVELLEGVGAAVTVANHGRQAVDLLSLGPQPPPFDVVLMDLQMPEMDGYQATTRLRSDARFATLIIIAMTAHATMEERQRCLAIGMNDHISKPIDPASLFETVGRYYKPTPAVSPAKGSEAVSPVPAVTSEASPKPATNPDAKGTQPGNELPSIAGLDTKDGLGRVAGNRKLYLKLLRQFSQQQASTVTDIKLALEQRDTALAERLAHTLKGVAGNIGAKPIQAAAGAVERMIRERASSEDVRSAQENLAAVLDPLVAQLQVALVELAPEIPTAPKAGPPVDPFQARETAGQLIKLLSEFDPGAADFVEANQGALRSLFDGGESWTQFQNLVQGYAFGEAQGRLEQAIQSRP